MGLFSSTLGALKRGLGRTNAVLGTGLVSKLRGRDLNEELIEEIEAHLLRSDVGVTSTRDIVETLRTSVKQGQKQRGEDVVEYLKSQLTARFDGAEFELAAIKSALATFRSLSCSIRATRWSFVVWIRAISAAVSAIVDSPGGPEPPSWPALARGRAAGNKHWGARAYADRREAELKSQRGRQ